jgi:HTH-type transcriptional regulator, sugar sensing transcriptional regulator
MSDKSIRCPENNGHMSKPLQEKLEHLGLAPTEAAIYLILLRNRQAMGASSIAARAEMARSSVYPAVTRLIDLGLLESEPAYGSGFTAVPPDQGLASLIERETEELSHRERMAKDLLGELESLAGPISEIADDPKMIQVLRDPRSVLERFERLERSTKHQIDCFVKPPHFNRHGIGKRGEPEAEQKVLRRGIRVRGIYEKGGLEDPAIKPYLHDWVAAGEEARVYDGQLPHKMIIFDSQNVLLPLLTVGGEIRAVLVYSKPLAETFALAFERVWERSQPIEPLLSKTPTAKTKKTDRSTQRISRNGRSGQTAKT